jgi:hypothetical protein
MYIKGYVYRIYFASSDSLFDPWRELNQIAEVYSVRLTRALGRKNELANQLSHSIKALPLEKAQVAQLFKNFPTFYETLRLITVFTRAYH